MAIKCEAPPTRSCTYPDCRCRPYPADVRKLTTPPTAAAASPRDKPNPNGSRSE